MSNRIKPDQRSGMPIQRLRRRVTECRPKQAPIRPVRSRLPAFSARHIAWAQSSDSRPRPEALRRFAPHWWSRQRARPCGALRRHLRRSLSRPCATCAIQGNRRPRWGRERWFGVPFSGLLIFILLCRNLAGFQALRSTAPSMAPRDRPGDRSKIATIKQLLAQSRPSKARLAAVAPQS